MPLNPVQVKHVNEVIRPSLEKIILADDFYRSFMEEIDALQAGSNALPTDNNVLDDNATGTAPRADAPTLTGAQVALLRTRVGQLRGVLSASERQTLIDKCVRDLLGIRGE